MYSFNVTFTGISLNSFSSDIAISELKEFRDIPVKVTLNEYIEISKDYSTEKSSFFINGILDKIVKDLIKNNSLIKEGRGLRE